jgi:hypothetical protein
VREGDAAVLKRPLRFGMRRRVVWTRPERGRESSRVTLSTRPPRRSRSKSNRSPYAPVGLCSRRPSQTYEMPVSPLIFDTTLGVGATEVHATCLYPFLRLRERFETVAAEVTFSPFWAGKFRRRAKTGCVVAHLCRGVSRMKKKQKNKKILEEKIPRDEGSENYERGAGRNSGRETRLWAGKRNFCPARDVAVRKKKGVYPSYRLRRGSPWPSRGKRRML